MNGQINGGQLGKFGLSSISNTSETSRMRHRVEPQIPFRFAYCKYASQHFFTSNSPSHPGYHSSGLTLPGAAGLKLEMKRSSIRGTPHRVRMDGGLTTELGDALSLSLGIALNSLTGVLSLLISGGILYSRIGSLTKLLASLG